jgi:hypothetical protein
MTAPAVQTSNQTPFLAKLFGKDSALLCVRRLLVVLGRLA